MKLKIVFFLGLFLISNAFCDGPLNLKGLYHDIRFDDACMVIKNYPHGNDVIFENNAQSCGFVKKGKSKKAPNYQYVNIVKNATDGVDQVFISEYTTNQLFHMNNIPDIEFLKTFVNGYEWIDEITPKMDYAVNIMWSGNYKYFVARSPSHGWQIEFGHGFGLSKKSLMIYFFKPSLGSFD